MMFSDVNGGLGGFPGTGGPDENNSLYARSDFFSMRVPVTHNPPNPPFKGIKSRFLLTPLFGVSGTKTEGLGGLGKTCLQ